MDALSFLLLIGICWLFLLFITENRWIKLKNPEIGLGYALFRTTRFNNLIDKITGISRRFWSYLFDVGLLVCLGILIAALLMFGINIINYIQIILVDSNIISTPVTDLPDPVPLVPAIPGFSISFKNLPYFFVAIMIAAALHELAHGIAARAEKVRVKNTGLLFFFVFFGAFVEPDEKDIKNVSARKQMRIYASGAFFNLLLVIILLPLLITPVFFSAMSPLYESQPAGALIVDICPSNDLPRCPAAEVGISPGTIIQGGIFSNGTNFDINNQLDFSLFSQSTYAEENISLRVLNNNELVNLTTTSISGDNRGFIGVLSWDYNPPRFTFLDPIWPFYIYNIIFFTLSLSLVLALVNLLPFPPLDGDKFISALLRSKLSENNSRFALKWIRIFTIVVFLGNIIFSIFISGVTPI
ncbi:MAG: site-2 protease family protein [Candidatus Hodarchaeales archaeon]|jgi:membrane-associated protease RseP (regulator of RpoE activity)